MNINLLHLLTQDNRSVPPHCALHRSSCCERPLRASLGRISKERHMRFRHFLRMARLGDYLAKPARLHSSRHISSFLPLENALGCRLLLRVVLLMSLLLWRREEKKEKREKRKKGWRCWSRNSLQRLQGSCIFDHNVDLAYVQ